MPLFTSATALRIVDAIAIVLNQSFQLARARLASAASPVLRMLAERDHAHGELALLRREVEILRGQRESLSPHRRPDYTPEHRLAILQLMRLRDWSIAVVAKRFVLHPNTIRSWIKSVEGRGNERLLASAVVWNQIDDVVRWAVHELRRLCPEPEFGTRTIARHLVRAGIAISRTTVQKVLREPKPHKPRRRRSATAAGVEAHHLLVATESNRVWHLDLTTLRILWMRFTVAAVLDAFTRRLIALRVYKRTPRTAHMVALLQRSAAQDGTPRFIITDHGPQFRKRFSAALKRMGARHVRSQVGQPFLNGKVERLFRSLRIWWRFVLPRLTVRGMQQKLDAFLAWYNEHRVHAALGPMTPCEAAACAKAPASIPIRRRDPDCANIQIARHACRGDPGLPIIDIRVQRHAA